MHRNACRFFEICAPLPHTTDAAVAMPVVFSFVSARAYERPRVPMNMWPVTAGPLVRRRMVVAEP